MVEIKFRNSGKYSHTFSHKLIINQKNKKIYVHDRYEILWLFLDRLNIIEAKKAKLRKMMCYPLPYSYSEWYLKGDCFLFSVQLKVNSINLNRWFVRGHNYT